MSASWTLFIVILTVVNIVGAVWLLFATSGRVEGGDTTGHTWDGDLKEYNNPLPRWWLWLFYGTVAFSIAYLVLFPGLGNWKGTLGWSQVGQWQTQVDDANQAAAPVYQRFAGMSIEDLQKDPDALRVGRNLFANNCAQCHGSDGRGATHFPNLTDGDWLWGGAPDIVQATISNGRIGVMPPWIATLGEQGTNEVIAYVLTLSGQQAPADLVTAGKAKFEQTCAACHGMDGKGNQALGAPNLTDNIWLHGNPPDVIRESIVNGRNNQMPAQLATLGEQKVRVLAAYVLSLAPPAPPAPAPEPAAAPAEGTAPAEAAPAPANDAAK
jgi:cytochrome c oxidase cbb3-type subunit 3